MEAKHWRITLNLYLLTYILRDDEQTNKIYIREDHEINIGNKNYISTGMQTVINAEEPHQEIKKKARVCIRVSTKENMVFFSNLIIACVDSINNNESL